LAGQGVAVKENQSESRTEGFDRISGYCLYLLITEKCPRKSTTTHVARLRRQALPEATQEAAPKGQEAAEEVLQAARAVGHGGVARDASKTYAVCPRYYQGLSTLYRPDLCSTTAESAENGHVKSCVRAREEITKDVYPHHGRVAYLCAGVFCGSSVQWPGAVLVSKAPIRKRPEIEESGTHENCLRRRTKGATDAH
jgi:hypothetical protein